MATTHSFYDRYVAGEHLAVWNELVSLGDKVHDGPLFLEAMAVCKEIVRRAQVNLRILHSRLLDLGYEFVEPDAALKDAGPNAVEEIRQFEKTLGVLPLIAHVWYSTFASVDFSQADRQRAYLKGGYPPASPDIFGLGSHPVLVFQSLDRCSLQLREMSAQHEKDVHEAREYGHDYGPAKFGQFLLLGGWASNCDPKGFSLPSHGVDGVIYNDGGGDTYFVDELRKAFHWGGFPFWQWSLKQPKFYSPMEYRPNFEKLLPVLKEGLLEI